MQENAIKILIRDEMVEAGIVVAEGTMLTYLYEGREYLVMMSVVDITDWDNQDDE
jgi:hypothetical protein